MQKPLKSRAAALLLPVLALLLCAPGCVGDKRFDHGELLLRLQKNAGIELRAEGMYFAGGVYYRTLSINKEEDTLLTLKEDETGRLQRITLTLCSPYGGAGSDTFREYALALAQAFIPAADLSRLREETGLDDPEALRAHTLLQYRQGVSYRASLFGTDVSVSFVLEYA